jgi:predicted site-specific integrase-resolvase
MTVTTDEAAELAGIDPAVIRKWVLRGDLEPVRRGARPLRFDYDDVARVQREKRSKAWRARHDAARDAWIGAAGAVDVAR